MANQFLYTYFCNHLSSNALQKRSVQKKRPDFEQKATKTSLLLTEAFLKTLETESGCIIYGI